MADIKKSEAIILQAIRWQESSKILSLFARDWGLIKVIARGVLRKKSPLGGKTESLTYGQFFISHKQSRTLQILTDADVIDSFGKLRSDMDRLPYALAVLEIIKQVFAENHSEPVFFDFTIRMIKQLAECERAAPILEYFILKLASFLGFKPDFSACRRCGTNRFEHSEHFFIENGSVYCHSCSSGGVSSHRLSPGALTYLDRLQNHNHRVVKDFNLPEPEDTDLLALLLDYLNYHLEQKISLKAISMLY